MEVASAIGLQFVACGRTEKRQLMGAKPLRNLMLVFAQQAQNLVATGSLHGDEV